MNPFYEHHRNSICFGYRFVDPYFRAAMPDQVVVILRARELRIMTAIGDKKANRWQLQIAERWIVQYNFYVNDRRWGRMLPRHPAGYPFSSAEGKRLARGRKSVTPTFPGYEIRPIKLPDRSKPNGASARSGPEAVSFGWQTCGPYQFRIQVFQGLPV